MGETTHIATSTVPAGGAVARELLAWYDRARRTLPWRVGPGERADPYAVWLSEVLAQQTTAAVAGRYYREFLARWPNVEALAAAPENEVMKAWAGLGYYARARNMIATARLVAGEMGGSFPAEVEGLKALPGVGPYTAAAIAAIAHDAAVVPVDGNVERVVARLFAVETPLPAAKAEVTGLAATLAPNARSGDFAQALMDLGAMVCTPKRPACLACPLGGHCRAYATGLAAELPRRAAKPARPERRGIAFWVERADGSVLLRRRPPRGLLGGMAEVPSGPWTDTVPDEAAALAAAPVHASWDVLAGEVAHTFTHFHLRLVVWRAEVQAAEMREDAAPERCFWVPRAEVAEAGLPSLMRKVAAHALGLSPGR